MDNPAGPQIMSHHSGLAPQHFLLMIENSSALANFWPDLRDCYLPRLVEQLSGSHPVHLTNIFVSASRQAHDFHDPGIRQYSNLKDGLKDFQFNYQPDNRLSTPQIQTAVEFLSSPSSTTSYVRHLIVVAATTPTEFVTRTLHDPWQELANMLTQGDIHLHLALTSNLRAGNLPNLFEQTLKWQQNIEEPLWLPKYSTALIFRVSAQQTYSDSVLSETKAGPSTCLNPPRASRDVIPPDIYTTKSLDDVSSEPPSLVSQLQQFHGLTKKKVYGAKPPLVPFIKDERVRDRYRGTPTRLMMPPAFPLPAENDAPPLLARANRARSKTKPDRGLTSRHERHVDPYAPRRAAWYQPMSSPEGDSSESPYSSSTLSLPPSPVAPISAAEMYPFGPNSSVGGQSAVPLEQPWLAASNASDNDLHPPFYPVPGSQASFHPGPVAMSFHGTPREARATAPTSPPFLLSPLGSPTYIPQTPCDNYEAAHGESNPQHTQEFHDEPGRFPFPLQAALPAHAYVPPRGTAIPEGQRKIPIMQPTPMFPPISPPELQDRVEGLATAASQSMHLAKARHASSAAAQRAPCATASSGAFTSSSSSLTGWAG
ncbi:hypothetical protein DFH09DRAFT_601492 [Mycena vulgaris]|nr:hypothetical protein DFH09DRAFT_601492 [Mycena vulgaris]